MLSTSWYMKEAWVHVHVLSQFVVTDLNTKTLHSKMPKVKNVLTEL
jgi:hypothetical protein